MINPQSNVRYIEHEFITTILNKLLFMIFNPEGTKRKISEEEQLSEQDNKRASLTGEGLPRDNSTSYSRQGSQARMVGDNTGGNVRQGGNSDGSQRSESYGQEGSDVQRERGQGDRREVYHHQQGKARCTRCDLLHITKSYDYFVSLCTPCNNHIILTFLLFKYTKITCDTKWNRTVLYFKNVACNLKYVACNTKKHRCTRCDLLYITESYMTNHNVYTGLKAVTL